MSPYANAFKDEIALIHCFIGDMGSVPLEDLAGPRFGEIVKYAREDFDLSLKNARQLVIVALMLM